MTIKYDDFKRFSNQHNYTYPNFQMVSVDLLFLLLLQLDLKDLQDLENQEDQEDQEDPGVLEYNLNLGRHDHAIV